MQKTLYLSVIIALILLPGCRNGRQGNAPVEITLATTTSTYDSGLLDFLLPEFEETNGIKVNVISTGTGQAIEIGRRGDCDIILVHARNLEDRFVAEGHGAGRWDVMYNDYVILGPKGDPAAVHASPDVLEALGRLVAHTEAGGAVFVSRGDNSGTHNKEKSLWDQFGLPVERLGWYNSVGQGMGDTLVVTNEMRGYTLSDRGTWLAMRDKLPNLAVVYEGDASLFNPYGIIPVNPEKHGHVKYDQAMLLVEFFVSPEVQARIGRFGMDKYGQPLFFPNAR